VKGDTLTKIATKYNTTVEELVRLNDITNPNYIVIGQVLQVDGAYENKSNANPDPTIKAFGVMTGTANRLYATWKWDKSNTDHYEVLWEYDTGDGVWFVGERANINEKQDTYDIPSNAVRTRFRVKAVSKKHTVNGKETAYWSCGWSTIKIHYSRDNPPSVPPIPNVTIVDNKLTMSLDNLNVNASHIEFQVIQNNSTVVYSSKVEIKYAAVSMSISVADGAEYKVRCRAVENGATSAWSNYSGNTATKPAASSGITTCKASSETSVYLEWGAGATAKSYDIEYATKKTYFEGSNKTTIVQNIETTRYELTGLATGEEYFFRVRSVNDKGYSAWTAIVSVILGKEPVAPTTWSSTTTAIAGEPLILYWAHNSEDGSSQTFAELELILGYNPAETIIIQNSTDEDEKDKVSTYTIDTTGYTEGTVIQWRVRTAGVTQQLGDWSIQRVVDIYGRPSLQLNVRGPSLDEENMLTAFPFYVEGLASPNTQTPTGYHVSVISNEIYETVDSVGNVKMVNKGEEVYSKYFDISSALIVEMSAGNINLENNISYTVHVTVSMNSGLTASAESSFTVAWDVAEYSPNAEISVDTDTLVAYIRPYCEDGDNVRVEDISLSVYRREFDGSFTELATGVDNASNTFITDPHPALDLARYRVVATSNTTGAVRYYDLPGYPIGEGSIVIQWSEAWTEFDTTNPDPLSEPAWVGSMLKLPYNIDVSDNYDTDVALIKYIGRKHPVSYYGTHIGETSTWSVVIPKDDVDTLYALRRLAIWMDDVYVREPSGSGYWARISVSFSQKHDELTIPVTLNLTRVEGGM
jgi:murein DD-endopeptidase MepM/ murein hydrolase activator NlpD